MTSECRFCGEEISWRKEKEYSRDSGFRWVPTDPETKEEHNCEDNNDWSPIANCRYCNAKIIFKSIQVSNRDRQTGQITTVEKRLPFDPDNQSISHNCNQRKEAWLAELFQKSGRSDARPCKNSCGTLVFWNYDQRSKKKLPLPFEEATNTLHRCPNYNPPKRR